MVNPVLLLEAITIKIATFLLFIGSVLIDLVDSPLVHVDEEDQIVSKH